MIGSDDGFSPSWFRWTDGLGSFLISVDGRKMNEMLCHPMMPRKAIESIEQGRRLFPSRILLDSREDTGQNELQSLPVHAYLTLLNSEFDIDIDNWQASIEVKYECTSTKLETRIGAYYMAKGLTSEVKTNVRVLWELHFCSTCCGFGQKLPMQYNEVWSFKSGLDLQWGQLLQMSSDLDVCPRVYSISIFGNMVNFSSRMESTSQAMWIQCPHLK